MGAPAEPWADAAAEKRLAAESRLRALLFVAQSAGLMVLSGVFWASGWSRALAEGMASRFPDAVAAWPLLRAAYVALAVAGYECLMFPLSVWEAIAEGERPEERFGRWLLRHAGLVAVEAALLAGGFTALYAAARALPGAWWLAATGGYAVLALGVGEWAPTILLPRLLPPREIDDPALLEAVREAGRAFGREVAGICEWDVPLNDEELPVARLVGAGRRVKVAFPEGLPKRVPRKALVFLAARKMAWGAHVVNVRLQIVRTLFAGAVFFFTGRVVQPIALRGGLAGGAFALGAFPLLVMALFGFAGIAGLFVNALARRLELRADALATARLGGPAALERHFRELYADRPFQLSYPWWQTLFRTVPSPVRRLAAIRR